MEAALDVLAHFEVETLLLYTTEDVRYRFTGPGPFQGQGIGRSALRKTLVGILRSYLAGFEPWMEGHHVAEDFAVLEWRCQARTATGAVEELEGLVLLALEGPNIKGIRGLFSSSRSSENSQGQEIDKDGKDYGDDQEKHDGNL